MAKKIKAVECPKCGSTSPYKIGEDRYRCDKCATEFFIDNDDININVRHQNQQTKPLPKQKTNPLFVAVFVAVFVLFVILVNLCSGSKHTTSSALHNFSRENVTYSRLVPINGKAVLLCITNSYKYGESDNRKYTATFRDVESGKILKESAISGIKKYVNDEKSRFFKSDSTYYVILQNRHLYKIDLQKMQLTEITDEIASRKPALSTGFSTISFIDKSKGEGFEVTTKLGKEFYYFPHTDALYTERAFEYAADLPADKNAKDAVYYRFFQYETKVSSNATSIFEFKYKFNNGGPEQKITYMGSYQMNHLAKYRVTSAEAITDDIIAFRPKFLYYDNNYILIRYRVTAASDAATNVQLFTTKGDALWSVSFEGDLRVESTVHTSKGFMLQVDDDEYYSISIDGQNKKKYEFPEYD